MTIVVQAGLLAPVDTATLEQVAPAYRPSTGRWIGIAARSTAFVYSKTKPVAPELLHSLLDLADPVWKGRWAASPTGGDLQAIVSGLLELKGEAATLAWLKAMKTNSVACRIGQTIVLVDRIWPRRLLWRSASASSTTAISSIKVPPRRSKLSRASSALPRRVVPPTTRGQVQPGGLKNVSSQTLMAHSCRLIRRMRYGTDSKRQRHNDRGGPSSDAT
jgi:Bacterial extracellular solute-binding protein